MHDDALAVRLAFVLPGEIVVEFAEPPFAEPRETIGGTLAASGERRDFARKEALAGAA